MPTITVVNPKGGSGKTTTALLLASGLAAQGASVAMLDGDPNPNLFRWAQRRGMPTLDAAVKPAESTEEALAHMAESFGDARFVAVRCRDSVAVPDWLDALSRRFAFVIADPEGTANDWVNHASAMSNLVLIPLRPAPMDAEAMLRAVKLVQSQSKALQRDIPYRLLFTCIGLPTKDAREIREHAAGRGHKILSTSLAERAAYRAIVARAETLAQLPEQGEGAVTNLDKAKAEASRLIAEVLETMQVGAGAQ